MASTCAWCKKPLAPDDVGHRNGMGQLICEPCDSGKPDAAYEARRPTTGADVIRQLHDESAPPALAEQLARIVVSTLDTVPAHTITGVCRVVSAECAQGIGFLSDLVTSFSDFFGGQSKVTQSHLRKATEYCLQMLRVEAFAAKADAVLGVRFSVSEFSGQGKSMLFVVATGTAVTLQPTRDVGNG